MAFSVLIGNMIGAKKIRETKAYIRLGITIGALWGITCSLIMITFR